MKNDNTKLAEKIYDLLGGRENILDAYNCMTRLRLVLQDKTSLPWDKIKHLPGVMGINDTQRETQIILGAGTAAKVTDGINNLRRQKGAGQTAPKTPDGTSAFSSTAAATKKSSFMRFMGKIASVFLPIIPGFIACGLITGLVGLYLKFDPAAANYPIVKILSLLGNSVFWGMNLFVGYNAAKVFGGTPILGGVLAAFISHPGLSDVTLGDTSLVSARGGVISVLLVSMFAAAVEKKVRQAAPDVLELFLTPLATVLIAGMAAIFVLQPLGGAMSDAIGQAVITAVDKGGAVFGFVLAAMWLPMVMFGLHQVFMPIHVDLIARFGYTVLFPICAMAGAGQVGAAFAVYLKTKNKRLKQTAAAALPVGMLGVGEPLIYGVTFPLVRPFIAACIGAGCGGAWMANFAVGTPTPGISGLPLAAAVNQSGVYLAGVALSYIAGFTAAKLLGFNDPEEGAEE